MNEPIAEPSNTVIDETEQIDRKKATPQRQNSVTEPSPRAWTGPDSTGASLAEAIKKLPPWAGDDFEECLAMVKATRGGMWVDEEGHIVPAPRRIWSLRTGEDALVHVEPNDDPGVVPSWYGPNSTTKTLLEHMRSLPDWVGDDLEDSLAEVIQSRTQARF